MTDYNDDYQLEDAENDAVQKSKNLKRGLAAGAAVLGVGGASAYGANKMMDNNTSDSGEELSSEDILAGAQAGADDSDNVQVEQHRTVINENHVHLHKEGTVSHDNPPKVVEDGKGEEGGHTDLHVEETAVVYDENGDIVALYDAGTFNGKQFMVMDTDGNGMGDIMAFDENDNGIFEDEEIKYLDNETYEIGKGENLAVYQQDVNGNVNLVNVQPNPLLGQENMAQNEPQSDDNIENIHNDFEDEKTGEVYRHDLAENNPDYNNRGGEQYTAEMETTAVDSVEVVDNSDYIAETADDVVDYGYQEPTQDYTAYDSPADSFDDSSNYDA